MLNSAFYIPFLSGIHHFYREPKIEGGLFQTEKPGDLGLEGNLNLPRYSLKPAKLKKNTLTVNKLRYLHKQNFNLSKKNYLYSDNQKTEE